VRVNVSPDSSLRAVAMLVVVKPTPLGWMRSMTNAVVDVEVLPTPSVARTTSVYVSSAGNVVAASE